MNLEEHPTVKRYREKVAARPAAADGRLDAQWLKEMARESGADDVVLISITSPAVEDQKADILALFPRTKSLISIVCRLNPENVRCVSRDVSDLEYLQASERVNFTAQRIVAGLGRKGARALSTSSGFPMDLSKWPGRMWPLSHKPIAVAGGLGVMGLHRLVIHPRFGSFVTLGTILADAEATAYDGPLDYNPCIGCGLCASVCPVGAVGPDGHFNFTACMTHNYRDRLGGFLDWVEEVVSAKDMKAYRKKVTDPESVSMWQSLSYGIRNKSSYCMAVCPAGEEVIGPFLDNRKQYVALAVKPLQDKTENVYVVPGSDAEAHVVQHFPHKSVKRVGNGLRPGSTKGFLESLPIVFQRGQSEGIDATYHFTFTGAEECAGTVVIRDKSIRVTEGLSGTADMHVIADSRTWTAFLAREKNLFAALLSRKIRLKGSLRFMKQFARCFPS